MNSRNGELISIIIPAYNAEYFIEETIQSVQDQTYENWELIIVNDGSTDQTEKVALTKAESDSRIHLISIKNGGVSNARNSGIKKSKGNYIALLDADDLWQPNNLEFKMVALNQNDEIDWVFSDMYEIDENSDIQGIAPEGTDINILDNILLWNGEVVPGPCSNIVLRKSCIQKVLFDTNLSTAADQDFCIQLVANGFKGLRIPEPLWKYRVLSNSMSRNISVMEKDHIKVFKKAQQTKLFKSKIFEKNCFSNLYLILAANWWGNGKNKMLGIKYLFMSIITYPPNVLRVLERMVK